MTPISSAIRRARMPSHDLSVIIPSVNSFDDLDSCLTALTTDQGADLEIIVVDRLGPLVRHEVRQKFPAVTLLPVPPGTTIPAMRAQGIRAAGAPAIAVIEDHVIVPVQWARRMLDALGDDNDVVGGAVDNAATETLVDWAAFLCEYSSTLPPLPAGPSEWLPGNNVIYRTETLRRYDDVLDEGKWENRLHDAMRKDGITLLMHPEIIVGHKMHYSFRLYMEQRFLYSRSYAGALRDAMPRSKQLIMGAAAAVALPPLMFVRTIQRIRSKKRHLNHLAKSLPLLVPFCLSWGAGEAAGYWLGSGSALSKVR
ncbi:MAG TPA: glycosyltransferase [Aliiroseovarius sp.]|nr:glycosyltransferase [Aliiroseovarius sp.]